MSGGNIARAVTGADGRITRYDDLSFRVEPLGRERQSPWDMEIAGDRWKTGRLGDLLSAGEGFHMLASHLLTVGGYLANAECRYGRQGVIRAVTIGGNEWRADALNLYRRKSTT